MITLGINQGWHDGATAIVQDGTVVCLIEMDRVSRVKNGMNQDRSLAIAACLSEAGMTLDDIDAIAFGWDEPAILRFWKKPWLPDKFREEVLPRSMFPRTRDAEMVFVPHHVAHAASGLYLSGWDKAGILVVDGRGECQCTSILVGDQEGIRVVREWPIGESLGNFYGYAAEWAGFGFWGPGKLMGLAPYGQPGENTLIEVDEDGYRFRGLRPVDPADVPMQEEAGYELVMEWYGRQFPFTTGDPGDIMAHAPFAATVQRSFEEAMFRLVAMTTEAAGTGSLVIAGGSGQNCTFNGALSRSGLVDEVFLPPVTHDTGVGLGAALLVDRQRRSGERPAPRLRHAYLGHTPTEESLSDAASRSGFPCRRMDDTDLLPIVAAKIAAGEIVGWFHGTAEIGQRALGARSMLCDPRDRRHLRRVNEVKGREIWRPLAPSVLEEYAETYFEGPLPYIAQFMLAAIPVRPEARKRIPATVHVDGSARPQIVRRDTNPRYWALIEEFRKLTGEAVVMNTSFNLASEPIVHTAEQAVRSFAKSGMDSLVLGPYLLEKPIR